MAQSNECFHAILRGQVQGVSFRYFAQRHANRLVLTGWVKNLPDGSVEVLALGPRDRLERLLGPLRSGPPGARVDEVSVNWISPPSEPLAAFEIRY